MKNHAEQATEIAGAIADELGIPFGIYNAYDSNNKPIAGAWYIDVYKPWNIKLYRLEAMTKEGGAEPVIGRTIAHVPAREFRAQMMGLAAGIPLGVLDAGKTIDKLVGNKHGKS